MGTQARTPEEYAGQVDQVIFELEDYLKSIGFDVNEIETSPAYLKVLLREMRELRQSMTDGSYMFGRSDLPFMRIVKQHNDSDLPFIRLFYQINQTHKEGLDTQAD
ncbi:MAG: hypothetical protein WBO06_03605 [Gammaproteobacteria bacterium]